MCGKTMGRMCKNAVAQKSGLVDAGELKILMSWSHLMADLCSLPKIDTIFFAIEQVEDFQVSR